MWVREKNWSANEKRRKRKKMYKLTAASCLTFVSRKAQHAQIQEEGGTLKGAAWMRKEGTPTRVCKQEGPLCTCERKGAVSEKKVEPEK